MTVTERKDNLGLKPVADANKSNELTGSSLSGYVENPIGRAENCDGNHGIIRSCLHVVGNYQQIHI
ncbi:hypothetical protein DSO57_1026099 [Entomophthora muscae]|uniref:Uncharacterized protein n=1 Tax=Entomophthora muscae TaxID=34485 RepID=A0ACC2RT94_9FUNG|nr:hypothetical protein DSO57_1026099 [Entomophthora muscae]